MPNTTAVSVTLTLSTLANTNPPFNVSGINGTVTYDNNGGSSTFNTWTAENVGTPQPSGAGFTLIVKDLGQSTYQTGIGNWALTFIPRSPTTQASPFGNQVNTITGNGGTANPDGSYTLNFSGGNPKIKNAGSWDWSLMVQITFPNGPTHCFASDPEMDVNP